DIVVLERGFDGAWKFGRSLHHGRVQSLAVANDGVSMIPEVDAGKATTLRHVTYDGQATPLIGAACPHLGQPTRAVAVDPQTRHLFRPDQAHRLAFYVPAQHAWFADTVTEGKVHSLFVSAGSMWAWLPQTKALYRRDTGRWQAYPAAVTQVIHDDS